MRSLVPSTLALAFFLGGCASTSTGPGGPAPATRSRVEAPVAGTSGPAIVRPPVSITEKAAPGPHATAKTRTGRVAACKIARDAVEWLHVRGVCKNGYAHGDGEARSLDGRRSYRGGFFAGAFHGEGSYDWGDGTRYTGGFVRGQKTGSGAISYPDGGEYVGEFKDNLYHGPGKYTAADGSVYGGEFQAGNFHGRGTYSWANGDRFTGEFRDNLMDGQGAYTRPNGETYTGQFRRNERSGTGAYSWPDGSRYTGRFEHNEINGEGTYTHADGSAFVGRFKNGKKHGVGKLVSQAREIEQRWENGRPVAEERLPAEDGGDRRDQPPRQASTDADFPSNR